MKIRESVLGLNRPRCAPRDVVSVSSPVGAEYRTIAGAVAIEGFRPERLVIPQKIAEKFEVMDVTANGKKIRFDTPITAGAFGPGVLRESARLDSEWIKPGDRVTIVLKNITDEPVNFMAAVIGPLKVAEGRKAS